MNRHSLTNFLRDESGQDMIEYALVASFVALALISTMRTLGGRIGNEFNTVGNSL